MEIIETPDDMSSSEKKELREYRNSGCPGLVKLQESEVVAWYELYMGGKTYAEIAVLTQQKKAIILYVSERNGWQTQKMNHYQDIAQSLLEKVSQARVHGANVVSAMVMALNKYYENKMDQFLKTGDNSIIENLDTKNLNQYLKCIESLDRLIQQTAKNPDKPNVSPVTVNITSDKDIIQVDEGTVEITDKSSTADMLKQLANYKKNKKRT